MYMTYLSVDTHLDIYILHHAYLAIQVMRCLGEDRQGGEKSHCAENMVRLGRYTRWHPKDVVR